jgi:hypothetical protein
MQRFDCSRFYVEDTAWQDDAALGELDIGRPVRHDAIVDRGVRQKRRIAGGVEDTGCAGGGVPIVLPL